jgi:hypothetical protein
VRAGAAVDRGLGEAAVDDHPAGQPGGHVGRPEADELAVGVDLVVLARGVGLGGAEALGAADEHHGDAARGERAEVVQRHVWEADRRQPGVDVADDGDAVVVEVEELHGRDAERDGDQRAGNHRRDPA